MRRILSRKLKAILTGAVIASAVVSPAVAEDTATFATPDEAVSALIEAVKSPDALDAIVKVLGNDGREIAASGDPVQDDARRARFLSSFDEAHVLQKDGEDRSTLVIGKDEYPFPIPIVKTDGKWRWDTAAGLDQLLTRRIGENELSAIEVVRTFVAAQLEYADQSRDGKSIQYARRLMSREGRKDGLFWPTADGEPDSPIGPLVAKAQAEGYKNKASRENGEAGYHGYVYRMLYGQGKNASGGARDYIVNDRMIGGFGLIATPADYGNSGVMTFIVNQDGNVFEKDLGPDSSRAAQRIRTFDPDQTWKKIPSE
jgi:hypothetical protein